MKASEILSKAADLIEPEGAWNANGRDFYELIPLSLFDAIVDVEDRYSNRLRSLEFVRRIIGKRSVNRWEATPGRTQAEVVSALRQAASLAKEQESANG